MKIVKVDWSRVPPRSPKWSVSLYILLLSSYGLTYDASCRANPPAILNIDAGHPGIRISPQLYGIFFEEINHGGEGGLYSEHIRNRNFQEQSSKKNETPVPGWELTNIPDSKSSMSLDSSHPLNTAIPRTLRIDITKGSATVANKGYWGVPVTRGQKYNLEIYARCDGKFGGHITAGFQDNSGRLYGKTVISGLKDTWHAFHVVITSNTTDPSSNFVITAPHPGTLWLGYVSLMPVDTWRHEANGLRPDVAQMIADLHPAFMRFPGGCYSEGGNHLAYAFRFDKSMGANIDRPGHWSEIWDYWSSDGLGFAEYLRLCEDIGAKPVYVLNCGYAMNEIAPMDQIGYWIDDASNAIEYANGPVTSKWGAIRAKNGHPKPYNLTTVEIGNENGIFSGRDEYRQHYLAVYKALKAKYPYLKTIADCEIDAPKDYLDEHMYPTSSSLWSSVNHYDGYNRKGPAIYVGEYACMPDAGAGNLRAALAEAAGLTGIERNSDIVRMISYAPMLQHLGWQNWLPNMIVMDNSKVYGTPSYYVQQMFSTNRPDVILPCTLTNVQSTTHIIGGVGLGTWRTCAEYRDLQVEHNGRIIYSSQFPNDLNKWSPGKSDANKTAPTWESSNGAYRETAIGDDMWSYSIPDALRQSTDYTLHVKARKLSGEEGFLIGFHVRNSDDFVRWNVGGWKNTEDAVTRVRGGSWDDLGAHIPDHIETGRWYDIKIELNGTHIRCYLDGVLRQQADDIPPANVAVVAGRMQTTGEIVVKVVNGNDFAVRTVVNLLGAGQMSPKGRAIELTSAAMTDENSLNNPTHIVPSTKLMTSVANTFTYTYPARSLTILRLKPLAAHAPNKTH